MNQYYWIDLYQTSKSCGYVKKGQKYSTVSMVISENTEKPEAEYSYLKKMTIIVEMISSRYVKEIKTGLIFPIVNIKKDNENKYILAPPGKHHTFVFAQEDKLLGCIVKTVKEIQIYDQKHPDMQAFKEDLISIKQNGKANMQQHKYLLKRTKIKRKPEQNTTETRAENSKIRRLVRQYKYQRFFK